MANAEKDAVIADMAEKFRTSTAAVITEYRGLTVAQLGELRGKLRGNATYSVVKNTLTERAAKEAGVEAAFEGQLVGPNAIAFVEGDPVEAAKGLRDFAKDNPLLVIKGGLLDGNPLTAEDIEKLAKLESREVLLGKLAGAMKAQLTQAAYLFNAPLAQTARVVDALRAKVEEQGPVTTDAPAADTTETTPEGGDEA
ncbi:MULTISPECIES: 50S ribosomal protein L10 [Janibacter]|uniref:Large ribosomal subunit protein uL10 n=1 Tax=Janibacter hoylei PVAS-1 TaxID=1210046 RepID=K1ELQ6_9MICO|nr:50S ribosomal protein L10 [Janibacter hoylei]EKA60213.1 50S ribosomal protein L10 [Janibacter hoylei PVAS-1]MCT1619901.1 50S ribosomal protein L10 [Janibacter hoylei]MCT2294109.1 50S ribosomal protein L10 [Janibacter hoylei]MCW4602318.1 50S ribosomal protein L10 [Janibacter hoylei]RWU82204.1 50S ribosomal protein L10 [Janibacter hoylei PVAS-1]